MSEKFYEIIYFSEFHWKKFFSTRKRRFDNSDKNFSPKFRHSLNMFGKIFKNNCSSGTQFRQDGFFSPETFLLTSGRQFWQIFWKFSIQSPFFCSNSEKSFLFKDLFLPKWSSADVQCNSGSLPKNFSLKVRKMFAQFSKSAKNPEFLIVIEEFCSQNAPIYKNAKNTKNGYINWNNVLKFITIPNYQLDFSIKSSFDTSPLEENYSIE